MRWHEIISEAVIKLGQTKPDPDAPSIKFITDLESQTTENPLNHRQRVLGQAKVEVSADRNLTVRLHDIQGAGQGAGTAAMKFLCQLADKHGVTIKLTAYGYADTPTEVLVQWYQRFGFTIVSDADDEDVDMMRNPV